MNLLISHLFDQFIYSSMCSYMFYHSIYISIFLSLSQSEGLTIYPSKYFSYNLWMYRSSHLSNCMSSSNILTYVFTSFFHRFISSCFSLPIKSSITFYLYIYLFFSVFALDLHIHPESISIPFIYISRTSVHWSKVGVHL